MQVIPVLNCEHVDCIVSKLDALSAFLPNNGWIHLDVSDARFTFHKTWNDWQTWPELAKYASLEEVSLEVHLMVEEPEEVIENWLQVGAKRIIVHAEALDNIAFLTAKCKEYDAELMISLNPETEVGVLESFFSLCNNYQVLAVNPGLSGQKFLPVVLDKISFLRKRLPDATIEVDGGMTLETAMTVKAAGANVIVADTSIFKSPDPSQAYREFLNL